MYKKIRARLIARRQRREFASVLRNAPASMRAELIAIASYREPQLSGV